jgi:acyl-[acyl-carrier-protein]-phospholipid O-acyltransferase/long-chain-fatty-acid--[acyl-carrier-protein] ligase
MTSSADSSRASTSSFRTHRRGFWNLIATQAQGAFSDNALKFLVIFWIVATFPPEKRDQLVPLVLFLFAAPFVLFSMAGGYLADRWSKRSVTVGTKGFEIGVMLLALSGLALENVLVMLAAIFLMTTQSALFSASKYGLLPELLPHERLSWGNGILELTTFLAIIAGTVAGGWLFETFRSAAHVPGVILLALAGAGLLFSLGIGRVPAADPARKFRANFLGDLAAQVREIRRDHPLWLAVLGNTYFWFLGALLQPTIVLYAADVLRVTQTESGYLQAALAVGIGLGSMAAGFLSGHKIEYGLIPLGALGMAAFSAALALGELSFVAVGALLAALGFFGGFVIVPINAMIQHRPEESRKGGVIAAANMLSSLGIVVAAGAYWVMTARLGWISAQIFLAGAVLTLAGTAYVVYLLPDALLRLLLWLLTHSLYRIRVEGRANIPERGGALFVSNHLSFVDALLLLAATERPIRFLMFKDIYDHPLVKPFGRVMRAIPISSQLRPRDMIRSLREASDTISSGEIACIFAEGQITRIGQLLPFRRGFERIMKDVDAPIIPVHLDGVWGSIFSFEKGRFVWKLPRRIPYPVTVSFGPPLPATAEAPVVRAAVQELHSHAYARHREWLEPLQRALVRTARRHPFRFAMADARTPHVSWGAVLARSVYLARRLRAAWAGQEMVGVLLPPSVGGALVNYAAALMGKVPVNLNYTASDEVIASCARQCNLETVITSREFLERVHVTPPGRALFIEDLAANPRWHERLLAALMAGVLPADMLERALGRGRRIQLDDCATVIFSSGSTGDPKGVVLTHFNIASNVEQMGHVFLLGGRDRILGILPFFHSFGFTATLWLPPVLRIGAVYHPNPLDARYIGALVEQYAVTLMVATPTFLQAYVRRVEPEQFGSLEFVLVGAEKLPERVARAFEERFGVRPLEGYGCTECAPVVAVNTRDYRAPGFRQVGAKRGKIGHPLPGISVRIVDPETMQPLPVGQPGLLLVRGPNVMSGYLGRADKTAEALRDGWYVTGDIATLDEDGFLEITDRLSRFSKIGGEMVPHIKVEEKLHELVGATEQCLVVTGVPDAKKGEKLVVLHTLPEERLNECLEKLEQAGLPNLWVPKPAQFFRVDLLPYLGSGKLDLRRIRETALKFCPEGF